MESVPCWLAGSYSSSRPSSEASASAVSSVSVVSAPDTCGASSDRSVLLHHSSSEWM